MQRTRTQRASPHALARRLALPHVTMIVHSVDARSDSRDRRACNPRIRCDAALRHARVDRITGTTRATGLLTAVLVRVADDVNAEISSLRIEVDRALAREAVLPALHSSWRAVGPNVE